MITVAWLLLLALVQDVSDADRDAARALLEEWARRQAEVETLSARFSQEVRTPLLLEPLRSEGRLLYRRRPACLVFEIEKPRETRVRFDAASYQVHRVAEKRAERFLFRRDDLAGALVQVFGPEVRELGESFRLTGFERTEEEATVRLAPESKELRTFLTSLTLVFGLEPAELRRVGYVNAEGDGVRIELRKVDRKAEIEAARFRAALPEGVELRTHVVERDG